MGYDFSNFSDVGFSESFVDWLVEEKWVDVNRHFGRLWEYYQNPIYGSDSGLARGLDVGGNYVQGQELGLPGRLTGVDYSMAGTSAVGKEISDIDRKEVVIENDIGWRVNAMVDFLFGKGVEFVSKAKDEEKSREIEKILKAVFAANGGVGFFQDMAVLGSVYGFVDCVVRLSDEMLSHRGSGDSGLERSISIASGIGLELIEGPRALPVLNENNYRKIDYYVQNLYQQKNAVEEGNNFLSRIFGGGGSSNRDSVMVTEVMGASHWQRYENKELVGEGENPLGVIPVVHVQNVAQPYFYEGMSDVEQLMGLQDELNTRLSDRANRITFQSFKMYLAKGIDGFGDRSVAPGRMWSTDNTDASIEEFGGDSHTPSEDMHIAEIREAMDKASGVTPVVAGVLKNKIGNLTSGVALKMTFMGMLAKTSRKQFTYGQGLKQICEMVLRSLDVCGVFETEASEREVELVFPNPLPEDMNDKLREAQMKRDLGVSQEKVLEELGY
jgi:hypothetical protein